MSSKTPEQVLRRSQLYRIHQTGDARFDDYEGDLCVTHYAGTTDEHDQVRCLGLADLSTFSRIGFKGRGASNWIKNQGARMLQRPNQALIQTDGSLLVRLSEQEVLVLRSLEKASVLIDQLQTNVDSAGRDSVYLLPRADSHCWLALSGENAALTLAKICGVDLRLHKFTNGNVAQTSLARVNAIVIRHDLNKEIPCFYILCDVSLTEFLWESLLDAMQEYGGQPVGLTGLRRLRLNTI